MGAMPRPSLETSCRRGSSTQSRLPMNVWRLCRRPISVLSRWPTKTSPPGRGLRIHSNDCFLRAGVPEGPPGLRARRQQISTQSPKMGSSDDPLGNLLNRLHRLAPSGRGLGEGPRRPACLGRSAEVIGCPDSHKPSSPIHCTPGTAQVSTCDSSRLWFIPKKSPIVCFVSRCSIHCS